MDPTDPNSANLPAGAPTAVTAQQFSSMAPFMLPDTHAKLRAAMMQQPGLMQQPQPDMQAAGMGYGG